MLSFNTQWTTTRATSAPVYSGCSSISSYTYAWCVLCSCLSWCMCFSLSMGRGSEWAVASNYCCHPRLFWTVNIFKGHLTFTVSFELVHGGRQMLMRILLPTSASLTLHCQQPSQPGLDFLFVYYQACHTIIIYTYRTYHSKFTANICA